MEGKMAEDKKSRDLNDARNNARSIVILVTLLVITFLVGGIMGVTIAYHAYHSRVKSAYKNQVQSQSPTGVPKDVEIEWTSERSVRVTKKGVEVFGENANVSYEACADKNDFVCYDYLLISYVDYHRRPDRVPIYDDNQDGKADKIQYKSTKLERSQAGTGEVFRKADELLARFRKELGVDAILKQGPTVHDPFVTPK